VSNAADSAVRITTPMVVATHNAGKLREIAALLTPLGLKVVSAGSLSLPEPVEDGDTFEANAALKAHAAAQGSGYTALSDDSGLCVPALDNDPGIYSARWGGEKKDFNLAMQKVDDALRARGIETNGTPAYFVCVLALADRDGHLVHMRGEVHGTLCYPPRGTLGFGYDPMFIPEGYTQSFGEIPAEEKHAMSHRARAFAALVHHLKQERAA